MPPGLAFAAATRSCNVFTFDWGDVTSIDADLPITPIGVGIERLLGALDQPVDHQRARRAEQQGITIGCGLGDGGRADITARSGAVLDDHLLAELVAKLLSDKARDDVGGAAGSEWTDQRNRARRPCLRRGDGWQHQKDRCGSCKHPS
jgi:hypothetical protein